MALTKIKTSVIPNGLKIESIPIDEINNTKPLDKILDDRDFLFHLKVKTYINILKRGSMPPIVIDSDNNIFDGQCRYRAHKELGAKYILCMRTA